MPLKRPAYPVLLFRQTRTLYLKNLLLFRRKWVSTLIRALILPVAAMALLAFIRETFKTNSTYGSGPIAPIRALGDVLDKKLVFVKGDSDFADEAIDRLVKAEKIPKNMYEIITDEMELEGACLQNLAGQTNCFAAIEFWSNNTKDVKTRGYTIHVGSSQTGGIDVDHQNSGLERVFWPLQTAVDSALAPGLYPQGRGKQWAYTRSTNTVIDSGAAKDFIMFISRMIYPVFFIPMIGVVFHLPGMVVAERDLGITALLGAHGCLGPARYLAWWLSFVTIYLPGWIIGSAFYASKLFPGVGAEGAIVGFHILCGMSIVSYTMAVCAVFKKPQFGTVVTALYMAIAAFGPAVRSFAPITDKDAQNPTSFKWLSAIFAPANYVCFISSVAAHKVYDKQFDLSTTVKTKEYMVGPPAVKPALYFGFAVMHLIALPFVAALIEYVRFSTRTGDKRSMLDNGQHGESSGLGPLGVRLQSFSVVYKSLLTFWKEPVTAVKSLDLAVNKGQIICLLGANGSGKTTTLQAIAGIGKITSGSIKIAGLYSKLNRSLTGVGVCPQGNVLWDNLTVSEHVQIWSSIKSFNGEFEKDDGSVISECDLWRKRNARSGTLSGGQKRKLQLAIMLAGGVEVCCMDEVSSGLDPLSRRKIHEIVLANRGKRTIIMATHFLDEADILADHIAILSKGVLQCEGASATLKARYGNGYNITSTTPDQAGATSWKLPSVTKVPMRLYQLENAGHAALNVEGPTMEDVFLNVAGDSKAKEEVATFAKLSDDERAYYTTLEEQPLSLSPGRATTIWSEILALYYKRWMVARRSFIPIILAIVIPIVVGATVKSMFQPKYALAQFRVNQCAQIQREQEQDNLYKRDVPILARQYYDDYDYDPSEYWPKYTVAPAKNWGNDEKKVWNWTADPEQSGYSGIKYIVSPDMSGIEKAVKLKLGNFSEEASWDPNGNVGIYYDKDNSANSIIVTNVEDLYEYSSLFPATVMANLALQHQGKDDFMIYANFTTFRPPTQIGIGDGLQVVFILGLAMAIAPAFATLYPTFERIQMVRAMQYSNGVRASALWTTHTAYEFAPVMLSGLVATFLIANSSPDPWYQTGWLAPIVILYAIASVLQSFIVSLFVKSTLSAFPAIAGGNLVIHVIFMVVNIVLYNKGSVTDLTGALNSVYYALGFFFALPNLLRAYMISTNMFTLCCNATTRENYKEPGFKPYGGSIDLYGGPVLYLCIQCAVSYSFLVWWDNGRPIPSFLQRKSNTLPHGKHSRNISSSSDAIPMTTISRTPTTAGQLPLEVTGLTYKYPSASALAVDDVSFSIPPSSTYILLGPNGAGKSTTISLLQGLIHPTSGRILIAGAPPPSHSLGVCPQFDAIDNLTVLQTLHFYARVAGVAKPKNNAKELIRATGLGAYTTRRAAQLSGGNRRKLSLAIALLGNPALLLLDEMSSGVDAAAKRELWRVLTALGANRALLATTHSMEEAEALVSSTGRVGILGGTMLAEGSVEELRQGVGSWWYIHTVSTDATHVVAGVKAEFGIDVGAVQGQVRFRLKEEDWPVLRDVYVRMIKIKAEKEVEFTVRRTTLEDVFVQVSKVYEEGMERKDLENTGRRGREKGGMMT